MLVKLEMVGAKCDHCKTDWHDDHYGWSYMSDESSMRNVLMEEDWHKTDDDKHYCPDCYSYDDNDNLVLNSSRKDKYKVDE